MGCKNVNKRNSYSIDLTTITSLEKKSGKRCFRWYWKNPTEKDESYTSWTPYSLYDCSKIEQSFAKGLPQYCCHNFTVIFNSRIKAEYNEHMQLKNKQSKWVKSSVIRLPSEKIPSQLNRNNYVESSPLEKIFSSGESNFDRVSLFNTSDIFSKFTIDNSNDFIHAFTSFRVCLEREEQQFLRENYVTFLSEFHNLRNNIFDFNKLKDILIQDMTSLHYDCYVEYHLFCLTQDNFKDVIVRMYVDEGPLRENLNLALRNLNENRNYIFYLLCLLFVFYRHSGEVSDLTVYRGLILDDLKYQQYLSTIFQDNTFLINSDFMSTTKTSELAYNYLQNENNDYKNKNTNKNIILLEINIKNIFNKKPVYNQRPLDLEKLSQYGKQEKEVLLPPFGIFHVSQFTSNVNFTKILLEFKTDASSLPFIKMS